MEISQIQTYIKSFDFNDQNKNGYFLKLIEEIGELSEAIRKHKKSNDENTDEIGEELSDVLYYICAIANVYDIDLEKAFESKTRFNEVRYNRNPK